MTQPAESAATMGGPVTDRQIIAAILLWRYEEFDTFDIAELLHLGEDQVAKTLNAVRRTKRFAGAARG